jgi:hypothetical protein
MSAAGTYYRVWSVSDWLSIPPVPLPIGPGFDEQLAGRFEFGGLNLVYEWSFNR